MADIDDEVLSYALALGSDFKLLDPLPGKSKKIRCRETCLEVRSSRDGKTIDRSDLVAHFIARLMSDRTVKITKEPDFSNSDWLIADRRTGLQLHFNSLSERQVREKMAEASAENVDSDLLPVEAARQRLSAVIDSRERAIVASRSAERKWPPAEGSVEARVLALAQGGEYFQTCRKIKGSTEWTDYKKTSATAFIAKLKDISLGIKNVTEHLHDSPKGIGMGLEAGEVFIDVMFYALDDASSKAISSYVWVAKVATPAVPKKDRAVISAVALEGRAKKSKSKPV